MAWVVAGKVKNSDDMTPFVLAADLGCRKMFEHLLEASKQVPPSSHAERCHAGRREC